MRHIVAADETRRFTRSQSRLENCAHGDDRNSQPLRLHCPHLQSVANGLNAARSIALESYAVVNFEAMFSMPELLWSLLNLIA
jgi:hypothetical protein